jgi:hypothetical protein
MPNDDRFDGALAELPKQALERLTASLLVMVVTGTDIARAQKQNHLNLRGIQALA